MAYPAAMLILFDVDATLITTSRTGIAAMGEAGREIFGHDFDEMKVQYAGRLDPLIIGDLLAAHGHESTPEIVTTFRAGYRKHLERLLKQPGLAKSCPGVPELLQSIQSQTATAMGLLTGNYPETGAIKLKASGIDPEWFPIRVWGCDSPHSPPARDHLPPIGMARYRAHYERALDPADVTIVGDTPHDIACAKAHGCRSLGVATGQFSVQDLIAAGADLAVPDLSHTHEVATWLMRL